MSRRPSTERVEPENFNRYAFTRPTAIGKPKVDIVAGFFEGRPYFTVVHVVGHAEDVESMQVAQDV